MYRIGIDVGGTFTDFTMVNELDSSVNFYKVPSTPHDPSEAIGTGISDLLNHKGVKPEDVAHIGHGTTVATNLIIERKGARGGLIATAGFRDVLEIGRQTRPHLFNYAVTKPPVLIAREFRVEVAERVGANGEVLVPLDEAGVRRAAEYFRDAEIRAITICFLHSYRNPAHELRAKEIVLEVQPDAYVSVSCEVLPEFREYERLSTTALNAAVGPRMETYLARFLQRVSDLGIKLNSMLVCRSKQRGAWWFAHSSRHKNWMLNRTISGGRACREEQIHAMFRGLYLASHVPGRCHT